MGPPGARVAFGTRVRRLCDVAAEGRDAGCWDLLRRPGSSGKAPGEAAPPGLNPESLEAQHCFYTAASESEAGAVAPGVPRVRAPGLGHMCAELYCSRRAEPKLRMGLAETPRAGGAWLRVGSPQVPDAI